MVTLQLASREFSPPWSHRPQLPATFDLLWIAPS